MPISNIAQRSLNRLKNALTSEQKPTGALIQVETTKRNFADADKLPGWITEVLNSNAEGEGPDMVKKDGVTHINISGRTALGQFLSSFAYSPFVHPYYGPFNCMEGFWYYIKALKPDDGLRSKVGWAAKLLGKEHETRKVPYFRELILEANYYKLEQNPEFKELFLSTDLPFDNYYLYGPGNLLIRPKGHEWATKDMEELRQMFREGRTPEEVWRQK